MGVFKSENNVLPQAPEETALNGTGVNSGFSALAAPGFINLIFIFF